MANREQVEREKQRIFNMFMEKTKCSDEEFAADLLDGSQWNITKAMETYAEMTNTNTQLNVNAESAQRDDKHNVDVAHANTSSQSSTSSSNQRTEKYLHRGWSIVYDDSDGANIVKKTSSLTGRKDTTKRGKEPQKLLKNVDTTFVLPNIHSLPSELQEYIEYYLVDFVTLNMLERDKYINWWIDRNLLIPPTKLWPLITLGDGNCLLHATSYSMWGEQDKTLVLRMELREKLKHEGDNSSLYRRWRWQQMMSNQEVGLVQTEDDFFKDWERLVDETAIDIKEHGDYESLEEFHVYVLSNLLKRPIIVYSDRVIRDVDGNPLSPVPFGGIYLPLDCQPADCHQTPILLCYDRCHFSAVVPTQNRSQQKHASSCIGFLPLVNSSKELFNVHYLVDPGENVDWDNVPEDKTADVIETIRKYLDVCDLTVTELNYSEIEQSSKPRKTVAAKLKMNAQSSGSNKISINLQEVPEDKIRCARLNIKLIENFDKNEKRFIEKLRLEYEERARAGRLRDPRTIPLIAHRDYHLIAREVTNNDLKRSNLATKSQHNTTSNNSQISSEMPSASAEFEPSQSSEKCKLCHTLYGTKDHHGMCSQCYSRYYAERKTQESSPSSHNSSNLNEIPIKHESELDEHIQSNMSRREHPKPRPFPTDNTTSYQRDYREGNTNIIHPYDRPSTMGHLKPDRPTHQLSLGVSSLHMISSISSRTGAHSKFSSSRYDDLSNLCKICRVCPKEYRDLCARCYHETRVLKKQTHRRVYMPANYKIGYQLCKREGCNKTATNTGVCIKCMEAEAAMKQDKSQNNYIYTSY